MLDPSALTASLADLARDPLRVGKTAENTHTHTLRRFSLSTRMMLDKEGRKEGRLGGMRELDKTIAVRF